MELLFGESRQGEGVGDFGEDTSDERQPSIVTSEADGGYLCSESLERCEADVVLLLLGAQRIEVCAEAFVRRLVRDLVNP